ncbi:MAG: DinB family protein, partial [Bryobacteraceae bacterium]
MERFRRGAELVAVAVTGAAGAELDFVPSPGRWSVRQILCHIADSELVGADRFRRTIAEDNPTLIAYDQEAWARNLDYTRRRSSAALESFRRLRQENHELLKDLPASVFERPATHSERGAMTLLDLLKNYVQHAENHARQMR